MNIIRLKRCVFSIFYLLAAAFAGTAVAQEVPWVGETLDGRACSSFGKARSVGYGPFDYRLDKDKLPPVEGAHFTSDVENLVRGNKVVHPMGDVEYVLRHFPNHHRALYSAVRYSLGESSFSDLRGERFKAECYLQRAIFFSPEDPVPYMLFGLYLHRLEKLERSLEMYESAEQLSLSDANLLYNIGLLHFDMGSYAESRRYAEQAYKFGISLPGLRRKLQEAGHW